MTFATPPVAVELTYADGSVKTYKQKLGDVISMTKYENPPGHIVVLIAPLANSQKDDI